MKSHSSLIVIALIALAFLSPIARSQSDSADISVMSFNSGKLLDRGSAFVGSSFIKGAVNVSDYSGNLTVGHAMDINYPNDLQTKLTLTFNADACHTYFEDWVAHRSDYHLFDTSGNWTDWYSTGTGVRGNSVNAALWVFGVNNIAVQTTNFEENFFVGSQADPVTDTVVGALENPYKGSQVPLLATGYQYTNDVSFPWDPYQRYRLIGLYSGYYPQTTTRDAIQLMNAEGSVLTLLNPTYFIFGSGLCTGQIVDSTHVDAQLRGVYFNTDEKSNGYAIVRWIDSVSRRFQERRIYYKPGDGLTYVFEEEYAHYQNYSTFHDWGRRLTNPPKIAYLRYIQAQNGDRIVFSYDYSNIFGYTLTNGRKFLKKIQYYKNSATPVSGTEITFDYVYSSGAYRIIVTNNLSGKSYTVQLHDYRINNGFPLDTIRVADTTASKIMQVDCIQDNGNTNKKASFTYSNHVRRYKYAGLWATDYQVGVDDGYYYLAYPTKLMTRREILNGERNDFRYCLTELGTSTALYDTASSFAIDSSYMSVLDPLLWPQEYSPRKGYFINMYSNAPTRWEYRDRNCFDIFRYGPGLGHLDSAQCIWYRYLDGYHFRNMSNTMRDNYTASMISDVTDSVVNGATAYPLRKASYEYTWNRKLYNGFDLCGPSNLLYNDLSGRIIDIRTTITTTGLAGGGSSAMGKYVETKDFELLKATSKFRNQDKYSSNNLASLLNIVSDSTWDEHHILLQSTQYNYKRNGEWSCKAVGLWTSLSFFDAFNYPDFMSLTSRVIQYGGTTKATVSDSIVLRRYEYTPPYDPITCNLRRDHSFVDNLLRDTSIVEETYRNTSPDMQMVKKFHSYSEQFGIQSANSSIDTSTFRTGDTNRVYRPSLPIETQTLVKKGASGSGTFQRKSRAKTYYYSSPSVLYGRIWKSVNSGATDADSVVTTYFNDSTGSLAGYPRKVLFDNGSDVQYKYNSEISPTGKLYCSDGSTLTNPVVNWSSAFQPAPFQTIKDYNGRALATFTAYDGKANLFFSVDENGYYSANYYDTLGRITKQLKPGNFYPNNPYLPPNGASAPYASMTFSYVDSLWTSKVTSTGYLYNAGANVQTMTQFRPDSLANENYAYTGTSWELKSKEKYNYLGRKWYSRDGDGVNAYNYYDAFMNPRQIRFTDSSASAPTKKDSVDYSNTTNYFKRLTTIDENGNNGYNDYDLYGNILKNVKYLGTKALTTRFTYNALGRLDSVITSEGKATKYTYDVRGNDSVRITPEAGVTQYLYDKYHNVRLIRDANHAGTATNPSTIVSQAGAQNSSGSFTLNIPGKVSLAITFGAGPPSATISITKNGATLCSATNGGTGTVTNSIILPKGTYGWSYTMTYPNSGYYTYSVTCGNANEFVYNKYDKLNRLIETGEYSVNSVSDFTQNNADNASFPASNTLVTKQFLYDTLSGDPNASNQRNLKGRISATYAFRLGQLCDQTSYSYDELGRVEWEVQTNLGSFPKKLYYWYDLQGNVTKKGYRDVQTNYNTYTFYDYDQEGRLLRVWTDTDSLGTTKVKDAEYSYYPSNRVQQVKLGATPVQTVDYTYNNRGWLRKINDPDAMGTDQFAMTLGYETQDKAGTSLPFVAQKNGNVSWVSYRLAGVTMPYGSTDYVCRAFGYDSTDRLTKAPLGYCSGSNWYGAGTRYGEFYSYSDDGNFQKLGRHDSTGALTDSLTYSYTSGTNQLSSYTNSAGSGSSYTYDANGNMVSDSRSNIAFAIYDIDNLPVAVYMTNGVSQIYSYDVNGSRVRKYASNGTDTYYLNDPSGKTELVQKGVYNSLYTYNISGADNIGQVMRNGVRLWRYYYLKDHLGSIRMTVGTTGSVDSYNDLYPYGMLMPGRTLTTSADARYKFTGKERDVETNYDYFGARYYDARVGRWLSVDPMAAKYPGVSGYCYGVNNPLLFVDPHGDTINANWNLLHSQYAGLITGDWAEQSGLNLSYDADGNIVYAKSSDGSPTIATDENGNPVGSEVMRNKLVSMIDNSATVDVALGSGVESFTKGNGISLGPEQIGAFINGTSPDLNNKTMGWGMTLMHELMHTSIGGGLDDGRRSWGVPGPVEDQMNIIRSQLNGYGQRKSYAALDLSGTQYIPMAPVSFNQLNNVVAAGPRAYVVSFIQSWRKTK